MRLDRLETWTCLYWLEACCDKTRDLIWDFFWQVLILDMRLALTNWCFLDLSSRLDRRLDFWLSLKDSYSLLVGTVGHIKPLCYLHCQSIYCAFVYVQYRKQINAAFIPIYNRTSHCIHIHGYIGFKQQRLQRQCIKIQGHSVLVFVLVQLSEISFSPLPPRKLHLLNK